MLDLWVQDEGPKESTNKAFVGGLSPDTTEEDLKNYFSQHGHVVEVSIPKPAEGKKRLFGFITFDDTDTVDQLISEYLSVVLKASCSPKAMKWKLIWYHDFQIIDHLKLFSVNLPSM